MNAYFAPKLPPALRAQFLRGEVLPAGAYNLRLRPAVTAGELDVLLDGAVFRSGLLRADALRVAAFVRAAALVDWSGR